MRLNLDARLRRVLALTGVAVLLAGFDGSVLFLSLPAVAAEFKASVPMLATLGAVLQAGSLGAVPLAALADRSGRRRLLAVGVAGTAIANLASGFAANLAWLAAGRVVAVCFEALVLSVAVALVVEEVPANWRGRGVAWLTVATGAGTGLTVLSYPLLAPHWRVLYLAGGIGLVAAPFVWWLLPEGRAWAAARASGSVLALLARPPWRGRLAVLAASVALGSALYEPAGLFVALFGSRLGLAPPAISAVVLVAGLASLPAFLVAARLSDAVGRRRLGVGIVGFTALGAATTFTGSLAAYWVGSVSWSILASASVPVLGAWTGELFPTRARATSETATAVAAAVGGAAGLLLVGVVSTHLGLGTSLVGVATLALVGAGLLLRLPETRGEPLP